MLESLETAASIIETEEVRELSPYKQRFADAPWFEWLKKQHLLILGAGGIGSWVTFCVSRIGADITLFDMDIVETHNLGGQLYSMQHVNRNKAEAIRDLCYDFTGKENKITTQGKYVTDSPSNTIVIACFDNMAARKLAFNKWVELVEEDKENAKDYLYIDGRLIAEDYQIYAVTPERIEEYRKTLFDDSEVDEVMCTLKATTHCSMGIAHDIVSVLTNFATNRAYGVDAREVPFNIVKSIPLFTYDIKLD
jgi:molybdopterin/thiamine biosynthesis adenylyltransferase